MCETPASALSFEVTNSGSIDTSLDSTCNGGIVPQPGAPSLCVLRYGRINVPAGITLKIVGTRPVALIADVDLNISGILDVSADGLSNGPGGGAALSGESTFRDIGGGGAGFQTAGANGGNATTDGGGGLGGAIGLNPATLAAFFGGPQSGATPGRVTGGGGGGGLALVSCRGTVMVEGIIDAGGGGGAAGFHLVIPIAARGGGAGGHVVIAAPRVLITGEVYANGGAGGMGVFSSMLEGAHGQDGSRSATDAAHGGTSTGGAGAGGAGGVVGMLPGIGLKPSAAGGSAGGGGGSVGFLQIYMPQGSTATLTPRAVSPGFQPQAVVPTR
ncbi:MAG: hypothetical protein H0T46_19955 [Deltaproteobacteria bacterium]|nr:hypothetical protein [Deltaproteobacteria bacterium]